MKKFKRLIFKKFINLKSKIDFDLVNFDSDKSIINIKNIDSANYGNINGKFSIEYFKILNDKKRKINFYDGKSSFNFGL